jgi:hypothetical protein
MVDLESIMSIPKSDIQEASKALNNEVATLCNFHCNSLYFFLAKYIR